MGGPGRCELVHAAPGREPRRAWGKNTSASLAKIARAPGAGVVASWRARAKTGPIQAETGAELDVTVTICGNNAKTAPGSALARVSPPHSSLVRSPLPPQHSRAPAS